MPATKPTDAGPAPTPMQRRNLRADCAFYDVGNLSRPEFNWLATQPIKEGCILVVKPGGDGDSFNVHRHACHADMLAAPGAMVQHFAVAGVGSSDVGAASLARTLADHLNQPVGAIVSGLGMADIVEEALGGWFYFGAANRATAFWQQFQRMLGPATPGSGQAPATPKLRGNHAEDTRTLIDLLRDDGRTVKTLLGHSKGCLSIAYALNRIAGDGPVAIAPFADLDVITAGAVVDLPRGLPRVRQYLGAIDWFGGMNSILFVHHVKVPGAWHHLNTRKDWHMDLSKVLAGAYD